MKRPRSWTHHALQGSRDSRGSFAGVTLLALLLVALPLARGGVDAWAEAAAASIALLALHFVGSRTRSISMGGVALVAVLGAALAQLVPVPAQFHRVSPGAVRIFETSLSPLGLYPAARPLTLDPAASARELVNSIACLAAFVTAWSVTDTRRRKDRLLVGLGVAGIAAAAVVLGAALIGEGALVSPRFPFVNRSHLAAFLNLTAFVTLALSVRGRGQARLLWVLGFATTGAVSFLSTSRGGILGFFLGASVFAVLHLRTRGTGTSESRQRYAALAGAVVAALGVAAYLALDPVLDRLATLRTGAEDPRVQLWRPALQVLRDFPLLGVGRGAFPDVFAGYQLESATYQFTHVENEWLQAVLDLGLPSGLLLVGTFAWIWIAAVRRRDLPTPEIGLVAGTAAVAAHNLVDFSLGVLGVAMPFAAAMGLLAHGQRAFTLRPAPWRAALAALAVLAAAGVFVGYRHGGSADQRRVEAARGGPETALAAREAALWHPADWTPHAIAGVRLSAERRCSEALPWLVRAMALAPTAPAPHLGAARCLAGRDDPAARREYRLAILFGGPGLHEAIEQYPALDDLFAIAPDTPDGLVALGSALGERNPSDALAVFRRALAEFDDPRALIPLARLSLRAQRFGDALEFARRHSGAFPTDPEGYALASTTLAALGREADAMAEAERGLAAAPGSIILIRVLVRRAMEARRWSEARRLTDEIAPRNGAELSEKLQLRAQALAGQGRLLEAIESAQSAAAARPDDPGPLLTVATLCEASGRYQTALDALMRASALGANSAALSARIAEAEKAVASAQGEQLLPLQP